MHAQRQRYSENDLSLKDVIATIAVKDMAKANKFYEDILGLQRDKTHSNDEVTTYRAGHTELFVYKSKFAGGYGATVATWSVGEDLENIVANLRKKGVTFEHYKNMEGVTLNGDIHEADDMKMAWFKDPDGNIINLVCG